MCVCVKALHAKDCETSWKNFSFLACLTVLSERAETQRRKVSGRREEEKGVAKGTAQVRSLSSSCFQELTQVRLLEEFGADGDHFLGRQTLESQHSELVVER